MNVLDVLILIIAILFGLNGFFRGLVHQLFFLLAVFLGIAGGMHLGPYVGKIFTVFTKNQDLIGLLGFALTFVLIAVTVSLLGGLIHRGARLVKLGWLDHALGAVFGVAAAALLVAFSVFVLRALLPAQSKFVRGSTFAPYAESMAQRMLALIPARLQRRLQEKLRELRHRIRTKGAGKQRTGVKTIAPPARSKVRGTGLVRARRYARGLREDLRYATKDNFLRRKLYPVGRCYLQKSVARRLGRVQKRLRRKGLGLKVWDCYRPRSIQYRMWKHSPKPGYVADPKLGSNHNRGAAVDVTLVDRRGRELAMPTDFDNFSPRAHQGARASRAATRNRKTLRDAMVAEGFVPIPTEWWHYDAPDASRYPLLDYGLDRL